MPSWSYLVDRNIQPRGHENPKPDFVAINYYSTATISESKGDSSDISARA